MGHAQEGFTDELLARKSEHVGESLVHLQVMSVEAGEHHANRRVIERLLETVLVFAGCPLRLFAREARSQRRDAERDVVRELGEQRDFIAVESVGLAGVEFESATDLPFAHQRQRERGPASQLESVGALLGIPRMTENVALDARLTGGYHRGHVAPVIPVAGKERRGGHRQRHVASKAGVRRNVNRTLQVIGSQPDPRLFVAPRIDHDAAHLLQKLPLVRGLHQRAAALAHHLARAVGPRKPRFRLSAFGDVDHLQHAVERLSAAVRISDVVTCTQTA